MEKIEREGDNVLSWHSDDMRCGVAMTHWETVFPKKKCPVVTLCECIWPHLEKEFFVSTIKLRFSRCGDHSEFEVDTTFNGRCP